MGYLAYKIDQEGEGLSSRKFKCRGFFEVDETNSQRSEGFKEIESSTCKSIFFRSRQWSNPMHRRGCIKKTRWKEVWLEFAFGEFATALECLHGESRWSRDPKGARHPQSLPSDSDGVGTRSTQEVLPSFQSINQSIIALFFFCFLLSFRYAKQVWQCMTNVYHPVIHATCVFFLSNNYSAKHESNFKNMNVHKRLCHAMFNSQLNSLYKKIKIDMKDLEKWYQKNSNHGISHFFYSTKSAAYFFANENRSSFIIYLNIFSPKLILLIKMCHEICNQNEKRVIA